MFEIGENVMHPTAGVCVIQDVTTKAVPHLKKRDYYVLKPVYSNENTTIFLPVDCNKVGVRRIFSVEEMQNILNSVDLKEKTWVDNDSQRYELFCEILKSGEHCKIIKVITELHLHAEERSAIGKSLRMSDAKILKEAEKIIHEEFAYAFNLKLEETADFIMNKLGIKPKILQS